MKDHTGDTRQYSQLSRAFYGPILLKGGNLIDEILMGFYSPNGGTSGEFAMAWIEVGGNITPRLEAFEDSWSALWGFRDLLERLKDLDSENPSPETICKILDDLGVIDITQTV